MFLIDDTLLFPIRSVLWVARQVARAAQQELAAEEEAITAELVELYMRLETGKVTEQEFDAREKELLDRLDEIQAYSSGSEGENGRAEAGGEAGRDEREA